MKMINTIAHPLIVLLLFLLLLISGEHTGGIYLQYILMGLSISALHAFLATAGILVLIVAYLFPLKIGRLKFILTVIALIMMSSGLVVFFIESRGYNDATFFQSGPLISLTLFAIAAGILFFRSVYAIIFRSNKIKSSYPE